MRMFLTGFKRPVFLRLATLELVRGEWRTYSDVLNNSQSSTTSKSGTLDVSAVNIEENGDKAPVNYIIPPGISRVMDPSQPQLRQQNEQAMSLKVMDLAPGDARAVYKNTTFDMRQYHRLKMFTHAEALIDDPNELKSGELTMFIRLGSDYRSNYYEYEIPLTLTAPGHYSEMNEGDQYRVWPKENMLDIDLDVFTHLKKKRNQAKNKAAASFGKLYSEYDENQPNNKISIIGNPSLAEVKTIMIGVRNNARSKKSAEIWVNELRLSDFNEDGGWAAQGNVDLQLSDVGSVNFTGHVETAGFGGLEQSVSQRRLDNYYQYQVTTQFELGRFLPKVLKLSAPLYFSYSKEVTSPKFNPLDQDMLLKDALEAMGSDEERDSIKNIANEVTTFKNLSLSNVRFNVTSENPMPYDPSNFTLSYSMTKKHNQGSTTAYEDENNWQAGFSYSYTSGLKPWQPGKNMKSKSKWLKYARDFKLNYLPQSLSFNTDMMRNYYELQLRDMENLEDQTSIPVSVSKDFLWNRDFSIRWDLTQNLRMSFNSATHAEVEEGQGVVNRKLYPDEYEAWKDTVRSSLRGFGRPLDYQQNFDASLKLPLDKLPLTDWITADAKFNSSYNWNRGVWFEGSEDLGNNIANQRSFDVNGRINFETLYNKVPFLKAANKKYASHRSNASSRNKKKPQKPKKYEKVIELKMDTTTTIKHALKTKRPRITAMTTDGKRYAIHYKVVDANTICIENRDSIRIKVTAIEGPKKEDQRWYKALQGTARFVMLIRNASISYKNTFATTLPGFQPQVGDMFGQTRQGNAYAPGLDFAFGFTGNDYIDKAIRNNWLVRNESSVTPASTNAQEDLQVRMTLEPVRDLKIDLNASWTRNSARQVQFMFDGLPETRTGNFNMTIITLGSAFERRSASNGYHSRAFEKLLHNLDIVRGRVESKYIGSTYPAGTSLEGKPFNPANGTVSNLSPDVMIPAFLAAYSGRDAKKASLDLIPNMLSMMPNWKVTYSGLSKLAPFKKVFKSFNINHAYRSTYSIGSYNTFQSFHSYMNDWGFIEDVQSGNPIPSSMYDVSSVSINEQFSPLIGVDMTFKNGLTTKVEYRSTRVLNLSMAANQVVENGSNDFVLGMGYKIVGLNLFPPRNSKDSKNKVSNDLSLRLDVSFRNQSALVRSIQDTTTQATSGNKAFKLSFSADYALSRMLSVRLFYDHQKNTPLVSAASYPVTTADFGLSLKFSLTR